MVLEQARPAPPPPVPRPGRARWGRVPVWLSAIAVVLLRVPFIGAVPTPDEAGYLLVARQWRAGGGSLYGHYWVDRPPVLLMVFQLASSTGGVPALRVLGCLAAAATVLLAAAAARRVGGPRAAAWCSVVTAAMLVSPLLGATEVNGELLAAPFVALSVGAALCAVSGDRGRLVAAGVTGGTAVLALLVKQNMADGALFMAVVWVIAWRSGAISGRRLVTLVAAAAAGGVTAGSTVAAWSLLHGSSLGGIYFAMYPFRLRAAEVIAASASATTGHRLTVLLAAWLVSGLPLLALALAAAVLRGRLRGRLRGPVGWALLTVLGFDMASVLTGGSFWHHYLVQLVVPTGIAGGLLAGHRLRGARVLGLLVVAVALVAWTGSLRTSHPDSGTAVGLSVRRAAHAHDTMVSAFGDATVVLAGGLRSPYPYLWSLPARTLDPHFHRLDDLLVSPVAPTWVVVEGSRTLDHLRADVVGPALSRRYHPVAQLCGRDVYLRDGVPRPAPHDTTGCRASAVGWTFIVQSGPVRSVGRVNAPHPSRREHL